MTSRPTDPGLNFAESSPARVYNYYLGGKSWSRVDAETAEAVIRSAPDAPAVARENFLFAGRAAFWAVAERRIGQVVDVGVGIVDDVPLPSVETRVLEADPAATVLAFDFDEVVLAHARALRPDYTGVLRGDVTDLDTIFQHPDAVGLIDMAAPVVVVLAAVLHFVPDPAEVMADLRARLAPGSVVVLSHATSTGISGNGVRGMTKAYDQASSAITFRSADDIRGLAQGWDIVTPPGLVPVQDWSVDGSYQGAPAYDSVRVLGMAAVLPDHTGSPRGR